jgi:hypothetical protein
MARRPDGTYYRRGEGPAPEDTKEWTAEEVAALAAEAGLGAHDAPPAEIGVEPTGGDELSEEELLAQEKRLRGEDEGRVVGPNLAPPDLMERLTAALESLSKREADAGANSQVAAAMVLLAESLQGLRTGQMQAAQLTADMQRRVTRPENAFPPNISAYNPRGDKDFPRPQLKCQMLIPWPVEAEAHTREEIELLNLLEAGEFVITRSDRSKLKLTVAIARKLDSDEPSQLSVNHETGFNNDNHKMLPHDWIRQLVMANPKTKAAAANVLTTEEEIALIAAGKLNDGTLAERCVSVGE